MRRAQLQASVDAAVLAPQPFAVEEVGTGEFWRDATAAEPVDRLAVELFGRRTLAQERARTVVEEYGNLRAREQLRFAFQLQERAKRCRAVGVIEKTSDAQQFVRQLRKCLRAVGGR